MSAAPSVIRRALLPHETQYTTIPNRWLRDERLSYKARGLLGYLLSHDDGFEVSVASLAESTHKEGREAIMSGLKELRLSGYLAMNKTRDRHGTFRTEYVLQEPYEPLTLVVDKSRSARSANPTRWGTRSANPTATRSANPTSIQNPNKEIQDSQDDHSSAARRPVDKFSAFWAEPCPSRWDGTTSSTQDPHRRRDADGLCAYCFTGPEVFA